MNPTVKEVMLMLRGELDAGDEYADLALACDALSHMYPAYAVTVAYNLTCAFLRHESEVYH